MKKILMLGGSAQQVPAIIAARDLGFYTVLIDYLPDNPGQKVADKWYQESTTDIEAVYRIAVEEGVDGILPYASDPAAVPAAIVSQRLGLPTNPPLSVEILGEKHKFRKFLKDNGFQHPGTVVFNRNDEEETVIDNIKKLSFPVVIKPTDSSGSKGVSFLNDTGEVKEAIERAASYSRNGIIIAEEFIEKGFPYVIGGDIFVEDGRIVLFGEMGCLRDEKGSGLIPVGKIKPFGLSSRQTVILHNELQRLVSALDIKNGEFNIELILDRNDKPYFLEMGPRAGGNMIPIQLSDIFGVDLLRANVAAATGMNTDLQTVESEEAFMTYVLHSNSDGLFEDISYSEEIKKYIYRKVHYKRKGDRVEAFDGAGKALGIVFMKFPDFSILSEFLCRIDDHIKVKLSPSD